MLNQQAVENVNAFFKKRSVEFGDVPRYNDQNTWPFFLPLIPDPSPDIDQFPPNLTQSLTGLGWSIAPGRYRDIPIIVSEDTHYHYVNHKLSCMRGPATGEITALANALNVVGVGTLFQTEFQVGDTIAVTDDNGEFRFGVIDTIPTNLLITLEAPFGPNAVTGAAATGLPAKFRIGNQWYEDSNPRLLGGIQVDAVGGVTGVGGTAFNTQLNVGQNIVYVDDTGTHRSYPITAIPAGAPGLTAMTINAGAATGVVAGAAGVAYKLSALPRSKNIRPLTKYLRSSIFMQSNSSTPLMGGAAELAGAAVYSPPSLGAGAGGLKERPVDAGSIQGNRNGLSSIYTPFQIPKEGLIYMRVHNTHNLYTLYVNGTIFGYKVAV